MTRPSSFRVCVVHLAGTEARPSPVRTHPATSERTVRILHLLAQRGLSGGEHQLEYLLASLADNGHESTIVLDPRARFLDVAARLRVEVVEMPMRNDLDVRAILRLRRRIRAQNYDLIHFGCSRSHKLGALACAGLRPCPRRVVTRRMDYRLGHGPLRRWLYASVVDAVVAISNGVRDVVLETGVDPSRVHVIHDGVDAARLALARARARRDAARSALGIAREALCGLTSASLHRRKGQDVLIDALGRLDTSGLTGPLVWLLAGEGPESAALAAKARAVAGVEIRLVGQLTPIEQALAAADIFCLPSRKEGLGVALLEAMAAGLPVVASAVGGMREAVVDGESGLLVPPEDPQALAEALGVLLCAPERRAQLGNAARARVRAEFDVARMCSRTEELYVRLVRADR